MRKYYYKYPLSLKFNLISDAKLVDMVLYRRKFRFLVNSLVFNAARFESLSFIRVRNEYKYEQVLFKRFRLLINLRNKRNYLRWRSQVKLFNVGNSLSNLKQFWCVYLYYLMFICRFVKTTAQAMYYIKIGYVSVNKVTVKNVNVRVFEGDLIILNHDCRSQLVLTDFYTKYRESCVFVSLPFFVEVSFSTLSFVFVGLFDSE